MRRSSCVLVGKQETRLNRSRHVHLRMKPQSLFSGDWILDVRSGLPHFHVHALPFIGERVAVHVLLLCSCSQVCCCIPSVQSLQSLIPKHAVSTLMVAKEEAKSPQAPEQKEKHHILMGFFTCGMYIWPTPAAYSRSATASKHLESERNSH